MQKRDQNRDHERLGREAVLLDVTRLLALRWTGRQANGIDRVCLAYLRHFAPRARAVVQHRGVILTLSRRTSRNLFDDLATQASGDRGRAFRVKAAAALAGALPIQRPPARGSLYLNVGHTDFDLPVHARWAERHGLRSIYLVHDLIPILHPQHCLPRAVERHTGRVAAALRHGSGIIVGSAAVERDLNDFAKRRRLTPPPVIASSLAGAELGSAAPPAPRNQAYFLCVGTIESRKNHALLLEVWERIRARLGPAAPRLVLVGSWGTGVAAFRRALADTSAAGGLIEVVEDCGDGALASLMQGARAVLMPSLAEGFGLPMAEALALGLPVIASDLPCFREVGQGVPCLLDPGDADAWEARIVAFDEHAALRQRRIDALHGYRPPTWSQHFERVERWLTTIAEAPRRAKSVGQGTPFESEPVASDLRSGAGT